jgi:hypothetical protein
MKSKYTADYQPNEPVTPELPDLPFQIALMLCHLQRAEDERREPDTPCEPQREETNIDQS